MDLSEVFVAQVRGLQSIYAEAHAALLNWGAWSLDRRGIGPVEVVTPGYNRDYRSTPEEYGAEPTQAPEAPAERADPIEHRPYDALAAHILDERLHSPGGPNVEQRRAIKIAYCSRSVPEYQFPTFPGCTSQAAFLERLEAGLRFAGRFV